MKVYLVQSPKDDGGSYIEVFSREGAIKLSRKSAENHPAEDMRSDDEVLADFVTVHWAQELTVLEG